MFDEKNVYVKQAEVKGSFKQSASGTFLLGELTVNASLKNYKTTLRKAFDITLKELKNRNSEYDETCKPVKPKSVKEDKKVRM